MLTSLYLIHINTCKISFTIAFSNKKTIKREKSISCLKRNMHANLKFLRVWVFWVWVYNFSSCFWIWVFLGLSLILIILDRSFLGLSSLEVKKNTTSHVMFFQTVYGLEKYNPWRLKNSKNKLSSHYTTCLRALFV